MNADRPDKYPDANYKPEMSIAISEFCAFSNFCPKAKLLSNLSRYDTLRGVIGDEIDILRGTDDESPEDEAIALKSLLISVQKITSD